ncbi:hypothetical protein [uncultured Rhodoblastus sp.]|uniref:hypothetical protein n=1 Tax=uncultured Rhodoblastus sp. TaxID=543037 RepID=UPI0025E713CF|nr:hypothetical protein [uncultured Rhodoblastus sp.]
MLAIVGSCTTGPAPQSQPLMSGRGTRKAVKDVGPAQTGTVGTGEASGFQRTGRIVRVMTFQSSLTWKGTTGCACRTFCIPPRGPQAKYTLFCSGRLMRSPTGFWICLASSPLLSALALSPTRNWAAVSAQDGDETPATTKASGPAVAFKERLPSLRMDRFPCRILTFYDVQTMYELIEINRLEISWGRIFLQ